MQISSQLKNEEAAGLKNAKEIIYRFNGCMNRNAANQYAIDRF